MICFWSSPNSLGLKVGLLHWLPPTNSSIERSYSKKKRKFSKAKNKFILLTGAIRSVWSDFDISIIMQIKESQNRSKNI
jgi:hypothetical protein